MLESQFIKNLYEAGCDEAGRGCLSGPVFAAAVILPGEYSHPLLNDSKKLSEKKREQLRPEIEKNAVAWAVALIDNLEIDKINILNASIKAMHLAIEKLTPEPQHIIVDGNRFKQYRDIPYHCIVKGDGKYYSIAAASVLAKTYRDDFMMKIHNEFPGYNWKKNKGYPTLEHRTAIRKLGLTPYHRRSFGLDPEQLYLSF